MSAVRFQRLMLNFHQPFTFLWACATIHLLRVIVALAHSPFWADRCAGQPVFLSDLLYLIYLFYRVCQNSYADITAGSSTPFPCAFTNNAKRKRQTSWPAFCENELCTNYEKHDKIKKSCGARQDFGINLC